MHQEPLDDDAVLATVSEVLNGGSPAAWQHLVALLHPSIERTVCSAPSLGPLRRSEDHRKNVITTVLEKLSRNGFRALGLLQPWLTHNPQKTALDWLRIVVINVARDYVESQLGARKDSTPDQATPNKRLLHTLASALPSEEALPGLRPPVTDQQTARQILDYAANHLPPQQLRALTAWLNGEDLSAVGIDGGTSDAPSEVAQKLVRSALARLRRQFAIDDAG